MRPGGSRLGSGAMTPEKRLSAAASSRRNSRFTLGTLAVWIRTVVAGVDRSPDTTISDHGINTAKLSRDTNIRRPSLLALKTAMNRSDFAKSRLHPLAVSLAA